MIKFLLIFFIVIYLVGLLGKWFFATLINKATSNSNYNPSRENQRSEGEISVEKPSQKSKLFKKNDGEYVDYEEVKE